MTHFLSSLYHRIHFYYPFRIQFIESFSLPTGYPAYQMISHLLPSQSDAFSLVSPANQMLSHLLPSQSDAFSLVIQPIRCFSTCYPAYHMLSHLLPSLSDAFSLVTKPIRCLPTCYLDYQMTFRRVSGPRRYLLHYRALFTKRLLHTVRNVSVDLAQVLIPAVYLIIACVVSITLPGIPDPLPSLSTIPSTFRPPGVPWDRKPQSQRGFRENSWRVFIHGCIEPAREHRGGWIPDGRKHAEIGTTLSGTTLSARRSTGEGVTPSVMGHFDDNAYHVIAMSLALADQSLLIAYTPRPLWAGPTR